MRPTARLFCLLALTLCVATAQAQNGAAVAGTAAPAEPNAPTRLVNSAAELKALIDSTQARLNEYQGRISESRAAAEEAPQVVDDVIAQLNALIGRFDQDGDIRRDLQASREFSQAKANEYGASNNPRLAAIAPRFEAQVREFDNLEAESAALVKTASEKLRELKDAKEALVALEEANMMDDVILVFRDSLKSFSEVVTATEGYLKGVEQVSGAGL